jgi:hypothetical protein
VSGRAQREAGTSVLASIGLALLLVVLLFAALNIGYMHYAVAKTIRERPELSLQPVPLPPAPPLDATATQVNCYGVRFSVPWGKPEKDDCEFVDAERLSMAYGFLRWTDGHEFRTKGGETLIDWSSRAQNDDDPSERSWTERCFGDMTATRYDAMSKMLHFVPRRPGLFDLRQLLCQQVLIGWKDAALGPAPTAIYSFQAEHGRGFQIGDPAHSREIRVHFYDKEYDHHHCLVFLAKPDAPAFTQSELDFILNSLRYIEEKPRPSR